jgi:transposase-like protein
MKSFNLFSQPGSYRFDADQRAQLLAAFERSGLSGAAFARQHGIHYTTFCGWRQRQAKARPAFVQVELAAPQPKRKR